MRPLLACLASAVALLALPAGASAAVLTIDLTGTGSGTVTSDVAGTGGMKINCTNLGNPGGAGTGVCSESYPDGLPSPKVNLTAAPAVHPALFEGWTGTAGQIGTCKGGNKSLTCEVSVTDFTGPVTAGFRFPPDPPTAATQAATPGPVPYTLTLNGQVNPEGEVLESCRFEYDTSPYAPGEAAHGTAVACDQSPAEIGEGTSEVAVSGETEPLQPGLSYHFRFVAANPGGTATGDSLAFAGPAFDGTACNRERRSEQGIGSLLLPSCMALEMVTPPKKGGQPAYAPTVSAGGERVLFHSVAALAGTPGVLWLLGDPYIASRTAGGWATDYTTQPGIFRGWNTGAEALSFTPDLSRWLRVGGTATEYYRGAGHAYAGGLGTAHTALSPLFEAVLGGDRETLAHSKLQGASADHSHLYFIPGKLESGLDIPIAFLPGDPEPNGVGEESNVYLAGPDAGGEPSLALMARDALGRAWGGECGAHLGGSTVRGAVSADGARTYFTTRPGQPDTGPCEGEANKQRILVRLEGKGGPWIGELIASECDRVSPPCSAADGDDVYRAASVDQSRVYFTTTRQLADTDTDTDTTADLYLHDSSLPAAQKLIQVSAGPEAAEVQGASGSVAISGDGSHAYFVAKGALTADTSPRGLAPVSGELNLYSWDRPSEELQFIGALDPSDGNTGAYPVPLTGKDGAGGEIGGDGHILLLRSKAKLSDDDEDGGFRDIFRYDAADHSIELISAPEAGVSGGGEGFDVATRSGVGGPGTDFAEQGRWASEDGETVVFKTAQKLVFGDANGIIDSYVWREGKLARLPGTADPTGNRLKDQPALSHDGSTVAFQSFRQLLPEDGDTAIDVYAAKLGGGYPFPAEAQPCDPLLEGDCQGPVGDPPIAPMPASQAIGAGNPPPTTNPFKRCTRPAAQAKRLSQRAKRLQRRAGRAGAAAKTKAMRRKARRLATRAGKLSGEAKRCRRRARNGNRATDADRGDRK